MGKNLFIDIQRKNQKILFSIKLSSFYYLNNSRIFKEGESADILKILDLNNMSE